ncbi:carboxypeptidase-like regulatory domain-containing protein [Chitinophaga caseinilytica]|uniref:Carboxypeptidase-like regulatory domain-containing protein n=1 Tax=Chitinophaga caseinilytica TaxID=2267521 RepID=A0ABZ2Z387_9BACT
MHRILYITLCLVLAGISANAQEKVKGRVIDALTRQALPNVTVQAGGTGCQTDASGRFTLHCPPGADSMKASCIGYAACCVKVSGETSTFSSWSPSPASSAKSSCLPAGSASTAPMRPSPSARSTPKPSAKQKPLRWNRY